MISSNLVDSLSQCKNTRPLIYDCCIIKRDHPKTTEKWNWQKIKQKMVKIKQKYQQQGAVIVHGHVAICY